MTAHSALHSDRPVGQAIPARARARPAARPAASPSLPVHSAPPNSCTSASSPRSGGRADCSGDERRWTCGNEWPAHSRPQAPLHAGTRWRLTGIPHLQTSHSHVHTHRHNHQSSLYTTVTSMMEILAATAPDAAAPTRRAINSYCSCAVASGRPDGGRVSSNPSIALRLQGCARPFRGVLLNSSGDAQLSAALSPAQFCVKMVGPLQASTVRLRKLVHVPYHSVVEIVHQ